MLRKSKGYRDAAVLLLPKIDPFVIEIKVDVPLYFLSILYCRNCL